MSKVDFRKQGSPERRARLSELEVVIEQHLLGFVEVGNALLEIRDNKLYLETHPTLEEWAEARFKIRRRRMYYLISAADIQHRLKSKGVDVLPDNESQIRDLSRVPKEHQIDVWSNAVVMAGDEGLSERHVRAAVREFNRQTKLAKIKEISKGNKPLVVVDRVPILLADPPWQYDGATVDPSRQIENQYPTMPIESIRAMDVSGIVTDDAVLFLWATAPLLPEALSVMEAWGFTYKTHAIWDKVKIGLGYWLRGKHELLLIGTRGNPPKPAPGIRAASILTEPRGKHSKKPDAVYRMIEQYYPDLPKMEMFCRQPRKGWSAWGNQA